MENCFKRKSVPLEKERINVAKYYLLYTMVFCIFAVLVYFPFWSTKTGFMYNYDGIFQHYYALMYYGKWLRSIFTDFVSGNGLVPKLWDFSIGYGSDVLSTLSYYVIGDPLTLSSAFVPAKYTEYLYYILVVLRFYLSGATFSAYCINKNKKSTAILAGAIAYCFCAYALHSGIKHPFFINPMIYFPLLLIGVDRILEKKKPAFFIFMVFISATSNFYFFYMLVLGIVIYSFFRFFTLDHDNVLKELGSTFLRFLLYGIIGTMMSMFLLLPTILLFSESMRSSSDTRMIWIYPLKYYITFIKGFLTGPVFGENYYTYTGYIWPVIPAIICLFIRDKFLPETDLPAEIYRYRKKINRALKIALITLTMMLCLPAFGKIFNGFSDITNRWVWIYSALIAYILTDTWHDIGSMLSILGKKTKLRVKTEYRKYLIVVVFILIGLHLFGNSIYRYDKNFGNRISLYMKVGEPYKEFTENKLTVLSTLSDDSEHEFWRYEKSLYDMENENIITGQNGVQYYWSLAPEPLSQFQIDMGISQHCTFDTKGNNARTFIDAISSVKYYCAVTGSAPYGYKKIMERGTEAGRYAIYENTYALPLGYTYDSYIKKSDFDKMTAIEKAQAILQGVIIDDQDAKDTSLEEEDPVFNDVEVACTTKAGKKTKKLSETSFKCKKAKSSFKIEFNGKEKCETYLLIKNLKINTVNKKTWVILKIKGRKTVRADIMSPTNKCYYGENDVLVNLGYYDEALTKARIKVQFAGTYSFDEVSVICQPMDNYASQIDKLSENVLDEKIGKNCVTGSITVDKNKFLCLSIPWSSGWTAYVDGKKQELTRANDMFMGLELEEGEHEIKLVYHSPGLKCGLCISFTGFLFFFLILFFSGTRKSERKI